MVCKTFEAHACLAASRAKNLVPTCSGVLVALPYSPCLESLVCDGYGALPACSMLAKHPHANPRLLAVQFCAEASSAQAVVAALAHHTQLETVFLTLKCSNGDSPAARPLPQLPALPALHSLILDLVATGSGAEMITLLDITSPAAMTRLTFLDFDVHDRRTRQLSRYHDEAYVLAAMQPVADALASLTGLCHLRLSGWTCAHVPAALACWQSLARALPVMPHLHTLQLFKAVLPLDCELSYFNTPSSSLARLSSLRTLEVNGWRNHASFLAPDFEASAQLAAAVGTLTGLHTLELTGLPFLSAHDRHLHLRGLTALTSLHLFDGGKVPQPEALGNVAADGTAVAGLLSGMTRLQHLQVAGTGLSAQGSLHLLSKTIPALPMLQELTLLTAATMPRLLRL